MAFLKNKTESVKLISRVKSGEDGFGQPIYGETEIEIPGVLVEISGEALSNTGLSSTDLNGKKQTYRLHIPKGDKHSWKDTFVIVRGHRCRTAGFEEEYVNPPLDWNKQIMAEYYE